MSDQIWGSGQKPRIFITPMLGTIFDHSVGKDVNCRVDILFVCLDYTLSNICASCVYTPTKPTLIYTIHPTGISKTERKKKLVKKERKKSLDRRNVWLGILFLCLLGMFPGAEVVFFFVLLFFCLFFFIL